MGPFGGGHLDRDVNYLADVTALWNLNTPLITHILESNDAHKTFMGVPV